MILKLYSNPQNVGWLGWIEGNDKAIGFVDMDGNIKFGWGK